MPFLGIVRLLREIGAEEIVFSSRSSSGRKSADIDDDQAMSRVLMEVLVIKKGMAMSWARWLPLATVGNCQTRLPTPGQSARGRQQGHIGRVKRIIQLWLQAVVDYLRLKYQQ